MYKIKALNKISPKGLDLLTNKFQLTENIDEAQGILVRSQDMHSMNFSNNLLCIARAGAGVNNIPLDRCADEGIVVFNTPGANANAVKELVLAGLLLSSRGVVSGVEWVQSLQENIAPTVEKGKSQFAGTEIMGKTLGIIGLGNIGVLVANAAVALGMNVLGYDAYLSVHNALQLSRKVQIVSSREKMLAQCDYVTIHVPSAPNTKGMINEQLFKAMKPGIKLLNFSRDSIIDEVALADAIDQGIVSQYVTDFPNERIMSLNNVMCFPHLGASTAESEENCAKMAVEQMMDYISQGNIRNSVNFPDCSMGICRSAGRIAILNKNIPTMLGQITNSISSLNISEMTNRSRDNLAYTLIDLDEPVPQEVINQLRAIDGVVCVRVIK